MIPELHIALEYVRDYLPEGMKAEGVAAHGFVYVRLTHLRTGSEYAMRMTRETSLVPALVKTAVQEALRIGWGAMA